MIAVVCARPFNEPGYMCNGGGGWQHVRIQQNGNIWDPITTKKLRRPQFFTCPANHTRDHVIELQLAKAYLLEDRMNSLSCTTINWLNTRANVRCIPQEVNVLKGEWFRELLTLEKRGCSPERRMLMDFIFQICWSGANVTCQTKEGEKPLAAACEGISLGSNCCCNFSDATVDMVTQKSIFWQVESRSNLPDDVREDLTELQRFLYYKTHLFCSGYHSPINSTLSNTTAALTTMQATLRPGVMPVLPRTTTAFEHAKSGRRRGRKRGRVGRRAGRAGRARLHGGGGSFSRGGRGRR